MNAEEIDRIVQAYGEVLEREHPPPGRVADAKALPFPKEQIKQALQMAILLTKDEALSEALIAGYLQLPDWQDGVGEESARSDSKSAGVAAAAERQALIQELGRLVGGAAVTRAKQRG